MGKRKKFDDGRDETKPIDLTAQLDEVEGECVVPVSKHRACWQHTLANLQARKLKVKAEDIERFRLTCPCFLGTFPQRKRSEGAFSDDDAIINQQRGYESNRVVSDESAISNQQNCDLSKRGVGRRNAMGNQKMKMDSGIFEHYLENLWRSFSEDRRTSFTYLDSLWFGIYMKGGSNVLSWIKKKDIFSKKYVFVPIVCWSHWSLLIFCHFGESLESKSKTPCMLLLDSLEMAGPRRLEPEIRKFVWDIYREEGRHETKDIISKIPLLVPKVPQQRDDKECGKYVLYFITLFVEGAPENFRIDSYPYFMKQDWFSIEGLEHFCKRLDSIPPESH